MKNTIPVAAIAAAAICGYIYASWWLLAIVCGGLWLLVVEPQRQRVAELRWYGSLVEPIVEFSRFPGDDQVALRAAEHRRKLAESGNRRGIPVLEFPYAEPIPGAAGPVAYYSFNAYLMRLGEFVAAECNGFAVRAHQNSRADFEAHFLNQMPSAN